MQKVRAGLFLLLGSLVLGTLVALVVATGVLLKQYTLLLLFMGVSGVILLALPFLSLVGKALCLGAPPEVGSRTLLVVALITDVAAMVVTLVQGGSAVPGAGGLMANLGALLVVLAFLLFLVWLRTLATSLQRDDLAANATTILSMCLMAALLLIVSPFLGLLAASAGGFGAGMLFVLGLSVVGLILMLLAVVRYAGLLTNLAQAVGQTA